MNHQSHFKQIINFKYEIQNTNQIYDHTHSHHTTHPTTLTPHNYHTYHHVTLHKDTSYHIQDPPTKEDTTNNAKSRLERIAPLLIEYAKTLKMQEQVKNEEHLDQNTTRLEDKFSTPRKNRTKQAMTATPKKKELLDSPQTKNNYNRKGLALISALIQEVLQTNYANAKRFTCAEISNWILDEFCRRAVLQNSVDSIDEREKKTIKRRVYDSINVLIALGKIKKDQKWLYVEQAEGSIGQEIVAAKKYTVNNMNKDLAHKQELLSTAKRQYEKLRQLKERNQSISQSKELAAEATVSTHQGHATFRFPLLILSTDPKSKLEIEIEQNQRDNEQIMVSGQPLYVMSELRALDLINLQAERNQCHSPHLQFQ